MANYDAAMFVGHGTSEVDGSYDPGATSGGKQEHIIAEQITDKAVKLCRDKGVNIHRDEQNYKDNDLAGNTYNYRYAIEVHLNAGGGKRAELFTPCKDKYLDAEFYMLAELAKLGLANGGVKSRDYDSERTFTRTNGIALNYTDYYGSINRAYKQGVSLDIIEIGFIDSTDLVIIEKNIDKIAIIIANGVLMVCGKAPYSISGNSNNQNNNNEKVEFDMKNLVCYGNDIDKRVVGYLEDVLKCGNFDARTPSSEYKNIENVIALGGEPSNFGKFSGYTKYHIKASNRFKTGILAIQLAERIHNGESVEKVLLPYKVK